MGVDADTKGCWIIFCGQWVRWEGEKSPGPPIMFNRVPMPACSLCGGEYEHVFGCPHQDIPA